MTKVNLLTIHYGKCYGAVMQTFATCRMLEQAGHVVRVINLINPSQKGNWKSVHYWMDCVREFQFWFFKKKYFLKHLLEYPCSVSLSLPVHTPFTSHKENRTFLPKHYLIKLLLAHFMLYQRRTKIAPRIFSSSKNATHMPQMPQPNGMPNR